MLETAWLLLAIELNGAIVSKGAQAYLDAQRCAVESKVMAPLTANKTSRQASAHAPVKGRQPDAQDAYANAWVTDASRCTLDQAEGVMRIRLPQEMLAEKPLALSNSSGAMGLALLHDPALLAGNADYSAQPLPQPIPSLAFDVFAGSDLNGLGLVASRGPLSAALLHQKPSQGFGSTRASTELFFTGGAQLRFGDFRAERGAEQAFGEYRGVHFANKAQPLKADGKAEAMLAVQSPSRVQFLDRNGMAIYSSEMLPPGNYRVQGFAASAVPGFLQAQIIDVNGSVQLVTLPWTGDRRLLLQDETEWDVFAGYPRALAAGLTSPPVFAAKASRGLSSQLTAAAHI